LILMKCNLVLDEGSFCTSISQAWYNLYGKRNG
jgi:hypothetical protein